MLAVAGVPMKVRLPLLKNIGEVPTLVIKLLWPLPTVAGLTVNVP